MREPVPNIECHKAKTGGRVVKMLESWTMNETALVLIKSANFSTDELSRGLFLLKHLWHVRTHVSASMVLISLQAPKRSAVGGVLRCQAFGSGFWVHAFPSQRMHISIRRQTQNTLCITGALWVTLLSSSCSTIFDLVSVRRDLCHHHHGRYDKHPILLQETWMYLWSYNLGIDIICIFLHTLLILGSLPN